jgi:hypothetical protein
MSKVGALTVPSSTLSDHHNATACPQSLLYLVFRLPGEPSKSIIGTLDCRRRTGNLSGGVPRSAVDPYHPSRRCFAGFATPCVVLGDHEGVWSP